MRIGPFSETRMKKTAHRGFKDHNDTRHTELRMTMTRTTWNLVYQDCKATPFGYCLGDLSTNQKPSFEALDQSEALILAGFSVTRNKVRMSVLALVELRMKVTRAS